MRATRRAAAAQALLLAAWLPAAGQAGETSVRTRATGIERLHAGAVIREDFNGGAIDRERWRVWMDDPARVRMEVTGGRLVIVATGRVGYNGLVSRTSLPTRDVEMVCRAGVDSPGPDQHPALVHLCGTGEMSPDNWFEIRLQEGGPGETHAAAGASVPPRWQPPAMERVRLAEPSDRGLLVKIVSDPAARLVRGMVRAEGTWTQVGEAMEIPARESRMEIKTEGFREGLGTSTVWFDDCRIYPRPETHYVTVRLRRPDGEGPGVPGDPEPWPLVLRDGAGDVFPAGEITLELLTGDGKTLVDRTHPGADLRYAVFTLEEAPWDTYPVAAVLRVLVGGRRAGRDLPIPSSGVEGLYPDDVYAVTLE